jgi:uncharacterized protein (DUF2147 family)
MKFSVFCLSFLLSFTVIFAQGTTPSTKETAPSQTVAPVKMSTPSTSTTKSPTNQVPPSTQKTPVTPANPGKASDVAPENAPATTPKDITGYWLTANKANIIQFYKVGDVYHGKIVWTRNKDKDGKPLTDVNNPDKTKRKNLIVGTQMVSNLRYNPKTKIYEGGKAYMPQTGKTYDCKAKLIKDNNSMEVTAMYGMSLMSKTLTWTRTTGVPSK